jgi:uncharacterized protein (TIGR02996 family)
MEAAFLGAIHEKPDDDDNWLVLTDWLEEDGQAERAELVRLQLRLRREPILRRRRVDEARVQALLAGGVRPCVPALTVALGMHLALVPPGICWMGSVRPRLAVDHDECPRHLVRITRAFYLGICQVTQGQYEEVMGHNPAHFGPSGPGADATRHLDRQTLPVENVSFADAVEFCRRLSARPEERKARRRYRLPTEAEWEYAARGCICRTAFHTGSRLLARDARFGGRGQHPLPVGRYRPNLFGLHDIHGNVWEWCADWYDERYYERSPAEDPPGPPDGHRRVLRGGGWSTPAEHCRSAVRGNNFVDARHNYNGFRVALSVPTG